MLARKGPVARPCSTACAWTTTAFAASSTPCARSPSSRTRWARAGRMGPAERPAHPARRTPLGVVGVIYESPPERDGRCRRAVPEGRATPSSCGAGGKASRPRPRSTPAWWRDCAQVGLPAAAIQFIPTRDRDMVTAMLQATEYIDVIVPRGGKGLVGLVQREARVPVFAHLEGICHVYADRDADLEKARRVVLNAKTRRTGHLRLGGMPADRLAVLHQAWRGADRGPAESRRRGAHRGRTSEIPGHGQGAAPTISGASSWT